MGRSGEFYTFGEAVALLGGNERQLKRRITEGLRRFNGNLFRKSDIDAIVAENDDRASISHRDTTVDPEEFIDEATLLREFHLSTDRLATLERQRHLVREPNGMFRQSNVEALAQVRWIIRKSECPDPVNAHWSTAVDDGT